MRRITGKSAAALIAVLLAAAVLITIMPTAAFAKEVKTKRVTLNANGTIKLYVGMTLNLTASVTPKKSKQPLIWSSSDDQIATVSNGKVTAVSCGTAKITVKSGKKKDTVKIKVTDNPAAMIKVPKNYKLPYVVYCSKASHTIAIIGRDVNGDFTKVIRLFPTGTGGGATRTGTFTIKSKSRWHRWGSTSCSPYASRHSGGLYVHGPLFTTTSSGTLHPRSYNAIGTSCSHGCLRTTSGCAAWVYYNCAVGTRIIIADNSRYTSKRPSKLSENATRDPTEPGSKPEIPVTGFDLAETAIRLEPGATAVISISKIKPKNNSTKGVFKYTSGNTDVATVDNNGIITAVSPGIATISVSAKDVAEYTQLIEVTVVSQDDEPEPEPTESSDHAGESETD